MEVFFAGLGLLLAGGCAAMFSGNDAKRATALGAGSAVVGSGICLAYALLVLATGTTASFRVPWSFPNGSFFLEVDALSAFFLMVVFLLTGLTAAFGARYLQVRAGQRRLGGAWFHFNALAVSMAIVVVARNGALFLIAWEAMALTSFFLVMFEAEDPRVRKAGWLYLVATHLGTACVLVFFAVASARAGSLDFDVMGQAAAGAPASALFLLAVAGFGTKAGFVPFHVWLPEAHPVAPAHVSAVMSGAMIKTGIYGLIRALLFLGPPEVWWGWLLIAIGITSGVVGVLYALAQHDLKRLLAYHSVENIGIIAMGLGVGLLGIAAASAPLVFLGFAGALLHVLNHAVFKSLLFLGAGAAGSAAGTLDIERLGGLMRRMPRTGASFLVGAAAITGLPPFNGFVSEFLIFAGAFIGAATLGPAFAIPLAAAAGALALVGGLAAACFVKAFGIAFLGEPRSKGAEEASEASGWMVAPQLALAGLCVLLGLLGPLVLRLALPAVAAAAGLPIDGAAEAFATGALTSVAVAGALVLGLFAALTLARQRLQRGRPIEHGPTWDCGYAATTPRMQYTASSFAAPLTGYFRNTLRTRLEVDVPGEPFPRHAAVKSATPDAFLEGGFRLAGLGARRALRGVLPLQNGRVQFYVAYLVVALLALLLWEVH